MCNFELRVDKQYNQRNMKKIVLFYGKVACIFTLVYLSVTSCEKMMGGFLDKPPGVDVTEDTVFSSQINAEMFLTGIYWAGMYTDIDDYGERWTGNGSYAVFCDEGENGSWWHAAHAYNNGVLTPYPDVEDFDYQRWPYRWNAIRRINILLDRIDDVPDASTQYKEQAKGQALFLRGLQYFEMFKRYGGVPIVDRRFDLSDPENLRIPRATIEDLVNFIVADADEAARLLPDSWPTTYTGKATKGSALMLKSKTLLYAASPLTNTATPPLSLPGEQNLLICYGNTDASRWEHAAAAAKAVLDWAPGAGIRLLTGDPETSYRDVWEIPDNEEIIMASKLFPLWYAAGNVWRFRTNFYARLMGINITQNFVEKYEKRDGTPQVWNQTGSNLTQMYRELDPRFDQSVAYNMCYWNPDFPEVRMYEGAPEPNQLADNKTGYWMRKFVPAALNNDNPQVPIWTLYRLGEAYLSYAEALNECNASPPKEAYDAVNAIRARAGMPPFPAGLTQAQFRERIRNERTVELAFEDHRLYDIMRWVIAEQNGVMRGEMRGLKIYEDPPGSKAFRYEQYVFEERSWSAKMYRCPFYQTEIDKGYLIQNPGY